MALICSQCKRELREKVPGQGTVGNLALLRANGTWGIHGPAGRLTGVVYAQSRIRGISKVITVSPVAYNKS